MMRAFLVGCLAAIVLAIGAYAVLNSGYVRDAASTYFSTSGVRI
jgi:hypothetical protein